MEDIFTPKGQLGREAADNIVAALSEKVPSIIDFGGVTGMDFPALRTLIRARQSGKLFMIINLSDEVAGFLDTTGASGILGACRRPREISLEGMTPTGGSFTAETYDYGEDSLLKVYFDFIPPQVAIIEKMTSRAALQFGLHTPIPGDLMVCGKRFGVVYERIRNKRSFARAISQEPENLEKYAVRFAAMSRELHATRCDVALFPDRTQTYRNAIAANSVYTDAEKKIMYDFIDSAPKSETCIHGDLHMGNVITNGTDDLWIDLGDFSYGNPLWDIAMTYFICCINPIEEMTLDLFHMTVPQVREFWRIFAREYFGADTDAGQQEIHEMMKPYAAIQIVLLSEKKTFPFMEAYVRKNLLGQ